MPDPAPRDHVSDVRRFSRFYTARIGLVGNGYLGADLTLTEGRALYELAVRTEPSAGEIGRDLGLDPGYLSRILTRFEAKKLLSRKAARGDRRRNTLALTAAGRRAFEKLDARSQAEVSALLAPLPGAARARLSEAMATVESLLSGAERRLTLRAPVPGDMGWIVAAHARLYYAEYDWDERFEALVAEIVAGLMKSFDPARERIWIAELDGVNVGSAVIQKYTDDIAKLRLLIVDPAARGLGLGRTLVNECIAFARASGYRRLTLWTQSILIAARHIYASSGFTLVHSEPFDAIGKPLISETWELEL